MAVSLVCFPSPDSLEKKKNSTLTHGNMSVYTFSVYCTSLLWALSSYSPQPHTSSYVVRYGRPPKNGGGSLKL